MCVARKVTRKGAFSPGMILRPVVGDSFGSLKRSSTATLLQPALLHASKLLFCSDSLPNLGCFFLSTSSERSSDQHELSFASRYFLSLHGHPLLTVAAVWLLQRIETDE